VVWVCGRTLLGHLRQQQCVLAQALNGLQQVTAQVHAVIQLHLLRLRSTFTRQFATHPQLRVLLLLDASLHTQPDSDVIMADDVCRQRVLRTFGCQTLINVYHCDSA